MSLFSKTLKFGLDTITSPIEIIKDGATLGGLLTDEEESYSVRRLKKLFKDTEEIEDEIDEL